VEMERSSERFWWGSQLLLHFEKQTQTTSKPN